MTNLYVRPSGAPSIGKSGCHDASTATTLARARGPHQAELGGFPRPILVVPHGEVLAEHRVQAAQMLNALIGLWKGRSGRQPSSIGWRGLLHKGHHVPLPRDRPEQ